MRREVDAAVRAGWWAWIHDPNDDCASMGPSYTSAPAFLDAARRGPVPPIARFRGNPAELIRLDLDTGDPLPGGIGSFSTEPIRPHGFRGVRRVLFACDEASILDDDRYTMRQIVQLASRRRHLWLGLIMVVQRLVDLPKILSTNATECKAFRTTDRDDLGTIKRRFLAGMPEGDQQATLVRISQLGRGEYLTLTTRPSDW